MLAHLAQKFSAASGIETEKDSDGILFWDS